MKENDAHHRSTSISRLAGPAEIAKSTAAMLSAPEEIDRLASIYMLREVALHLVEVDYSKELTDYVSLGQYDWCAPDILVKEYKAMLGGSHYVQAMLLKGGCGEDTMFVLDQIRQMHLFPGDLRTLLALGYFHPKVQLKHRIVALGTVWRNPQKHRVVAALSSLGSSRILTAVPYETDWVNEVLFVCRREISL